MVPHAVDGSFRPVVIVPTYNERENLPALVRELLRRPDLRIIIVDDGSPDGTGVEADRLATASDGRVTVLHRTALRGLGRSIVEGMRCALASDASHVIQMDADFSHDPSDVTRLIAATADRDLAIGSRYVAGGRLRNWPWHRFALSVIANVYVRAITGLGVRDCTSGFRCWRRDLLVRLPLDRIVSDGYAFQVEMTWQARAADARMIEVPITFVERREGASKMSAAVIMESIILPWRLVARGRNL